MKAFTKDWTTGNHDNWTRLLASRSGDVGEVLEIGCYEGRSTVFFLNFFPGARVTCIDPFLGKEDVEKRFDANVSEFGSRVTKIKGFSVPELDRLISDGASFDLIYIDGDHHRDAVMADSIRAWRMLRSGAIMIWDDYLWREEYVWRFWKRRSSRRPKDAIDNFIRLHHADLTILHRGYQMIVARNG